MGDEDIIVYGSDEQAELGQQNEAEIEKSRDERLQRVHTYAQRYLAGDRVYIHCARLKGPVVSNPWKKKKGLEPADWSKGKEYSGHEKMPSGVREFKRRRLMDDEGEEEVMANPTQWARARGAEMVEGSVIQKPGPKRKQAAPKKVVHEEEDSEEEDSEEEEYQDSEDLDSISAAGEVQGELHTITAAATGGTRKTSTTGKSNSQAATGMSTSRTKPKPRTTTSRNSSKASITTTASKKTAKKQIAKLIQEEVPEEITLTVKPTRGRGKQISAKPNAPNTQHVDGKEDEGEVSDASSLRRSKRKGPASVDKAKGGSHVSRTTSGEMTSKAKKTPMFLELQSNHATKPTLPLEATAAAIAVNLCKESFEMPTVEDPAEIPVNPPPEPITPIANLSPEEPTPPSIFYGPSCTSKNGVTGSANLTNRFLATRGGTSEPAAKRSNSKARTIPATGTKPERPRSAPAAVAKEKTGKKTTNGAAAIDTANRERKRKITAAIPGEEGESRERGGGGDDDQNDWIPASSDFKYKKGNGKKTAAVGAKDSVRTDSDDDAGRKQECIIKGKGRAKEAITTQQPKRKKPRIIDFAALSPFGGGQVVTKGGKAYSSPRVGQEDEGVHADERRADRGNTVGRSQTRDNVAVVPMAPSSLNTPSREPTSGEKADSSLREIPSYTNSQEATVTKESAQVALAVSQPSEARGSTTLSKELVQAAECNMSTAIQAGAPPVPALGTPGGEPQPTEHPAHVEKLAFAVPPPPTTGVESQSPWINTQRQLSVARKGFMSLLDTPIPEKTTPVKLPSATLSRLRRGPGFGLQEGAGTMKTPSVNPLSTAPSGSIALTPETPAPILVGLNPGSPVEGEASSGADMVPDTSLSEPITSHHRQACGESTATPAALSAFRARSGADVTLSSPIAVRGNVAGDSSGGIAQQDSIMSKPPPEFSPFKAFDTPTNSQFGSFMQGFSPLRYSPHEVLEAIEESQPQSTPQPRSQPQSSIVPIRLFGGDKHQDSSDPADKSDNQQRVKPSAWLGLSQSRTSTISLFNPQISIPARLPAPSSSPALLSSPPPLSPRANTPPSAPPPSLFFPSQEQAPSTPRFRRTSSTQLSQNGHQSPGTKLARDMLEMMGGGVWDIGEELNKIRGEDTQPEADGLSKALATPATGRGKLVKGLFNSGTRRVGSGKRRW